jgi:hypothetical protein
MRDDADDDRDRGTDRTVREYRCPSCGHSLLRHLVLLPREVMICEATDPAGRRCDCRW